MRLLRIISLAVLCGGFLAAIVSMVYILGSIAESLQH